MNAMSHFAGEHIVRMGLGLHQFYHFALSLSTLASDDPFFNGQKTVSLEIRNLLRWRKKDLAWWYR
ncbi:MAG: hypothetical protein M3Y08_07270 [Fibrobacterota bacterium]|nr:hypothetical protein [Fibrobacterota bacterium]